MLEKAVGPAPDDDPELEHDRPIRAFEWPAPGSRG